MKNLTVGAVAALALLVTGCSEASDAIDQGQKTIDKGQQVAEQGKKAIENLELPKVEWAQYPDALRTKIDTWVAKADCSSLRKELDKQTGEGPLTGYIETQMKGLGC